jgi:mannose-6-phosphate isomerase-like protein (cupin superfamily)
MNKTPVPISFAEKFDCFFEQWSPKVVAEMNDYQFKLVRLEGEFVWHDHQDTDETFIVLEGKLLIDFQGGTVELDAGQMLVVPKGVPHRPRASAEVKVLLVEPKGVINTGDVQSEKTAPLDDWI